VSWFTGLIGFRLFPILPQAAKVEKQLVWV